MSLKDFFSFLPFFIHLLTVFIFPWINSMEPSPIAQEYLLPDFSPNHMRGKIVGGPSAMPPPQKSKHVSKEVPDAGVPLPQDDQVLIMGNERFSVPELLFHPSDIGEPQIDHRSMKEKAAAPAQTRMILLSHSSISRPQSKRSPRSDSPGDWQYGSRSSRDVLVQYRCHRRFSLDGDFG